MQAYGNKSSKHGHGLPKGPASGVTVDEDCVRTYNQIKQQRLWRYVIYRLSDDHKRIIVDEKACRNKCFGDFVDSLKRAEALRQCRFGVYDVEYHLNDMLRQKLVFYLWSPDCAIVKQKMLYTSSKDTLKRKLAGISFDIQSTDDTELGYAALLEKCMEKFR